MNDCGTDPEVFSSTMDFLLNGAVTNNGVCPIDLELEVNQGDQGLEIVDFDPKIEDIDSSDDGREDDELRMHLRQACGDFSNAKIEERWIDSSSTEKSIKVPKNEIRRQYDELRETISSITKSSAVPAEPVAEPVAEAADGRQKTKSSRNRRPKFKNAAIESILEIKGISTAATRIVNSTTEENLGPGIPSFMPTTVNNMGLVAHGRGRCRVPSDNTRRNISMIRPECINGINANPDYDPNNPLGSHPAVREEFPPL